MIIATRKKDMPLLTYLCEELGCDVTIKNRRGYTALDYAADMANARTAAPMRARACVCVCVRVRARAGFFSTGVWNGGHSVSSCRGQLRSLPTGPPSFVTTPHPHHNVQWAAEISAMLAKVAADGVRYVRAGLNDLFVQDWGQTDNRRVAYDANEEVHVYIRRAARAYGSLDGVEKSFKTDQVPYFRKEGGEEGFVVVGVGPSDV